MNSAPSPSTGPRVTREQVRDLSRLRRPHEGRMLGGVCEGLSRHLDIDPLLIRVVFGALTVFGGAGIVLYIIAWLTIPDVDSHDSWASRAFRQDPQRVLVLGLSLAAIAGAVTLLGAIGFATPRPWAVITVSLVALVLFTLFSRRGGSQPSAPSPSPSPSPAPSPTAGPEETPAADSTLESGFDDDTARPGAVATAAMTAGAAVSGTETTPPYQADEEARAWWRRNDQPSGPGQPGVPASPSRPPAPAPRPKSRLTPITLAVMVLTLGGIWLADATGADIHPSVYPGSVLAISAAALMLGTWFGRAKLLIPLGLLSALLTAAFTVIGPSPYGERFYDPTTAAEVQGTYEHGAGYLRVNLDQVRDVDNLDHRHIDLDSHVGLVQVVIPTSVDAEVTAHVQGGDIKGPANTDDTGNGSVKAHMLARDDGRPLVTIDIDLVFGRIEILRLDCPGLAIAQHGDTTQQDLSNMTWEGSDDDPAACH